MAETRPAHPLICPSCYAREIDPIFLHQDPEDGTYYCTKCTYVATDRAAVKAFLDDLMRHKHGIARDEPC